MCEDCGMKSCRTATAKMEIVRRAETLQELKNENDGNNGRENIFADGCVAVNKEGHEWKKMKDIPDIIIIDDDDESGEAQNHSISDNAELYDDNDDYESGADSISQRKYRVSHLNCYNNREEHINENLKNHESHQLSRCLYKRVRKGEKRPVQILFDNTRTSSSSSDCEIIEDTDGKIQREWENAALRKQLAKGQSCQAESEESTTVTNPPGTSTRKFLHVQQRRQFAETSPSMQEQSDPCQSGSSLPYFLKVRETMPILFDQQDSNYVSSSDAQLESYSDLADGSESTSSSLGNDASSFNEETSSSELFPNIIGSNNDVSKVSPTGKGCHFLRNGHDELQYQRSTNKVAFKSPAVKWMEKRSVDIRDAHREWWQSAVSHGKQRKVEVDHANIAHRKSKRSLAPPDISYLRNNCMGCRQSEHDSSPSWIFSIEIEEHFIEKRSLEFRYVQALL